MSALAPASQRITALDAVRGVALFGILMVNVGVFSGPYPLRTSDPWTHAWDRAAYLVVDAFFANKFFPLFSFLFGVGFGLQLARAESAHASFARLWRRRMGGLFVIGLVHAALLSTIDILVQYALLGMLLYALRRARDRTLLVTAGVLLAVPVLFMVLLVRAGESGWTGESPAHAARMIHAYAHGTLGEFERQRVRDLIGYYAWVVFYAGWPITALFLVGYVTARRGVLATLAQRRDWLAATFRTTALLGVVTSAARLVLDHSLFRTPNEARWRWIVHAALAAFGDPALTLAYASGLAWWFTAPGGTHAAARFAKLGSNALTHYVTQSLVMSLVFFAARTYGSIGPAAALAIGVALYATQWSLAQRWNGRGPLESLWRRWTYAPMR